MEIQKRKRISAAAGQTETRSKQHVRLGEGLKKFVGGRTFVYEEELSRDLMLEYLKANQEVEEVDALVDVSVQLMDGASFNLNLERKKHNEISVLKKEIEERIGVSRYWQELFLLEDSGESLVDGALQDNYELTDSSCTVALYIRRTNGWHWDVESGLIKKGFFELGGIESSIVTKVDNKSSWNNCMMCSKMMHSGVHTISLMLKHGTADEMDTYCGLVPATQKCDEDPAPQKDTSAFLCCSGEGQLLGNGKWGTATGDISSSIRSGQVLTMRVDLDLGSLRLWRDSEPHGSGWSSGVTGPVRWAAVITHKGNSVEIVPNPELKPWSWEGREGGEGNKQEHIKKI